MFFTEDLAFSSTKPTNIYTFQESFIFSQKFPQRMQNEKNMPGHVLRELHRFLERNKKTRRTKNRKNTQNKKTRGAKNNTLTSQMVGILSAKSPSLQTGLSRNQVELLIADVKPLKTALFLVVPTRAQDQPPVRHEQSSALAPVLVVSLYSYYAAGQFVRKHSFEATFLRMQAVHLFSNAHFDRRVANTMQYSCFVKS